MFRRVGVLSLVVVCVVAGTLAYNYLFRARPADGQGALQETRVGLSPARDPTLVFSDTSGRRAVPCTATDLTATAVVLTAGQSNGANFGEGRIVAPDSVLNLNPSDGKCYVAQDPLLGATGDEGAVWTRLGERLVSSGAFARVIFIPIAVGGSMMSEWEAGGKYEPRLRSALAAVSSNNLAVTHVFWMHGESDGMAKTPQDVYRRQFGSFLSKLRESGSAPVYVARETLCFRGASESIGNLQAQLPSQFPSVVPGPDLDSLDKPEDRRDGCHFSAQGLDRAADLWFRVLVPK